MLDTEQEDAAVHEVLSSLITTLRRSETGTWLDALQNSHLYIEVQYLLSCQDGTLPADAMRPRNFAWLLYSQVDPQPDSLRGSYLLT
jgi:hypothetical protein